MDVIIDYRGKTPEKTTYGIPLITAKIVKGGQIQKPEEFISPDDYDSWMRRGLPSLGDVIITTEAPLGEVAQLDNRKVALAQRLITLRGKKNILNNTFLKYLMQSEFVQDQLRARASGSTVSGIKQSELRRIDLFVPPLPTQHAIARILGSLDDKIELNRQMNETLEAMAKAIFQSWFVDFDPVRAKAEGRQPAGMDTATAAQFPNSFEEVDGREVPKGWKITNVENIAEKVGMGPFGSSIKVETFVSEGMPIISGQHLQKFILDDTTFNFITPSHAEKLKNSLVYRGDVIFTHAGNIGQAAFIPENSQYEQYILSQRQFFLRPDQKEICPSYLALFFTSPEGKDLLLANTSSSGVPSIARPVTYLRSIPILVPPRQILDIFEKLVKPLLIKYRTNIGESLTLAQIRDTLLPKLMSGELQILNVA